VKIPYFDLQTGQPLTWIESGESQPLIKSVNNSYLEHWLGAHNLSADFFVGKFTEGLDKAHRQYLESTGKVLVFTNGKDGYFTDAQTASLLTQGSRGRGINPIFAGDRNSPHNLCAYGSLIASDGDTSTASSRPARILVIDDEQRSAGEQPLVDTRGIILTESELTVLFDKMGDGTMLVSTGLMKTLATPDEQTSPKQLTKFRATTVAQFRAATPDLPGMVKGTLSTSDWCRRLGVDAIISKNDIKGDDGRLSEPGLKVVSTFWVNRKSTAEYREQVVGPQVKGCIPEASQHEFNPRLLEQSQALAVIADDPVRLGQHYLEQQKRLPDTEQTENEDDKRADWLADILTADQAGLLSRFSKVNKELDKSVRGEWQDNATSGIYIPSAMAQNHAALMPWEVCNKDLPHGALVAYYRSPFPNAGAAAIGINNLESLRESDPEAFGKNGVAYLNPWTAKHIAITDFDGDNNGYFVGYKATIPDLPTQVRQALANTGDSPAEQYEAARSLFEQMLQSLDARLETADYPLAVGELIALNQPERRPPEITKQAKIKHPWQGQTHTQALWQAWVITADNPTGRVANTGMILQSLALECRYCPPEQREDLLKQISGHHMGLLEKAAQKQVRIPTDVSMAVEGFPNYNFLRRIQTIATAGQKLTQMPPGKERRAFVDQHLAAVDRLLSDVAEGPQAVNLQTAVDTAKSSRGINREHQAFAKALAHKEHLLRQNIKNPLNYVQGQTLTTNTQEPIGWGVEQTNQIYREAQLPEWKNEAFRDLFPKDYTRAQELAALKIARTYNGMVQTANQAKDRLKEKRPEDRLPTLTITSTSGKSVLIENINVNIIPILQSSIEQGSAERLVFKEKAGEVIPTLFYGQNEKIDLGRVAASSLSEHRLVEKLQQKDFLTLPSPQIKINPSYQSQNHERTLIRAATDYLNTALIQIPTEERLAYASALWRQSEGMGLVLKAFTPEVCERLQRVPEITLTGLTHDTNQAGLLPAGEYQVQFSENSYLKTGEQHFFPSVAVMTPEGMKEYGAISPRSVRLPYDSVCIAQITPAADGKTAKLQVSELIERGVGRYPSETRASEHLSEASLIQPYMPTLQELRTLFVSARASQDLPLQQRICELGAKLRGATDIQNLTPDFRHPSVVLQPEDKALLDTQLCSISKESPLTKIHLPTRQLATQAQNSSHNGRTKEDELVR
jgi:hypothetical protein